ncbi:trypsin inhibitor ClTI-1-like [Coregonus clupeaformis]|uniref:trypsin inhibitor ClTI-1-like n=1 Tax=Coregonus clupeaformis TaxID=59861 RepID=UPI001BDFDF9D|nr:trypsin inhibitor ClTI-1-like [Coregonus clupeaformis]
MWNFIRLTLALLCVAVLARGASLPDGSIEPNCPKYNLFMCTAQYDPVCGTDGITYGNECELCYENMKHNRHVHIRSKGEC